MMKHILVAVDFAQSSERAVDVAIDLARALAARITLVHSSAVPVVAYESSAASLTDLVTPWSEARVAQMKERVADVRRRWPHVDGLVREEPPIEGVLATAREVAADLIVVGTHARHGVERLLLGSIAEGILRDAPVPVLVVRAHAAP
ncbi:MAG: universal stress protein [Polyangiaceae bacterium]|nr:universal stress protein [Polyangiaceae bacterium]